MVAVQPGELINECNCASCIQMGDFIKSVSGYDRQVAPGVNGPTGFAVNKYSIGIT